MSTEQTQLSRIEKLKLQQQKLLAKIQREESRAKSKERKADTRRKVLAGACVLDKMKNDEAFSALFRKELDQFLKRNSDRILFDLPKIDEGN
jgi:hypothetical protein